MKHTGDFSYLANKKIGVWGYGLVGRSALQLLAGHVQLQLYDTRELNSQEQAWLTKKQITIASPDAITDFLEHNDIIIPSPGIDLRNYHRYNHKFFAELDLFAHHFTDPVIAITGSTGKTSVTHLLTQLLCAHNITAQAAGNIGTPMLSLIDQNHLDYAVLELSSFQLEHSKHFAPNIAVWTNIYPNHLDRHNNMHDYFMAKYNLLAHQISQQKALIPLEVLPNLAKLPPLKAQRFFFCVSTPEPEIVQQLTDQDTLFFIEHNTIYRTTHTTTTALYDIRQLPALSFVQNWLILIALLDILELPLTLIKNTTPTLTLPEHRLEKIALIHNVAFYNDSKSTTPCSTRAAVQALQAHPIHLLLGGLSKGIDRAELIQHLANKVAHIYCFGQEAKHLHALCQQYSASSSAHEALDDALSLSVQQAQPGSQIVLSPGGASFDLFANYQERGVYFKQLVYHLQKLHELQRTQSIDPCETLDVHSVTK